MARYQVKPNGEVMLILSQSEARGLEICARAGYVHIHGSGISLGTKIQETAALRAVTMLHQATMKTKSENEQSDSE